MSAVLCIGFGDTLELDFCLADRGNTAATTMAQKKTDALATPPTTNVK
jgi:hypothetical protein